MEKPKEILELEKVLSRPLNLVDFKFLGRYLAVQSLEYSLNDENKINGLCIAGIRLYTIPGIIGELNAINKLFLNDNQLSDITILSKLSQITILYLFGNNIRNIAPISSLQNLESILLMNNQISDLSTFQNPDIFPKLKSLYLRKNKISNLYFLKNLGQLENLAIDENPIKDLKPIHYLSNLKTLSISKTDINDLSPIKHLINLQTLNCSHCSLTDISPLTDLRNLKNLNIESNNISDISPLKALITLETLRINNNQIKKLEPWICNFPNMDIQWEKNSAFLNYINLFGNPIENIDIEIVKHGKAALFEWFNESDKTYEINIENNKQISKYEEIKAVNKNKIEESSKINELADNQYKIIFDTIDKSFSEKEFDAFCSIYFESMEQYSNISFTKKDKINWLIEHCKINGQLNNLLSFIVNEKKKQLEKIISEQNSTKNETTTSQSQKKDNETMKNTKSELLEMILRKKHFLQKELLISYDAEKKFALQEQIKELEDRILKLKE